MGWKGSGELATGFTPCRFLEKARRVLRVQTGQGAEHSQDASPAGFLLPLGDSGEELREAPGAGFGASAPPGLQLTAVNVSARLTRLATGGGVGGWGAGGDLNPASPERRDPRSQH